MTKKIPITIPAAGESVTNGVILDLVVKTDTMVHRDDVVLILETDKVNLEIPAPQSGVVEFTIKRGDTVSVGQIVGYINTDTPAIVAVPPEIETAVSTKEIDSAPPAQPDELYLAAVMLAKEVLAWRNRDIGNPSNIYDVCCHTNQTAIENRELAKLLGFIVTPN
jgi:pyruvate/2-oxoglutarate dehydrogenase complex dihydrolipoamide acyltransferase (E2) component